MVFVTVFKSVVTSRITEEQSPSGEGPVPAEGPAFVELRPVGLASLLRKGKGKGMPMGPSARGLPWGLLVGFGCPGQRMPCVLASLLTHVAVKLFSVFGGTAELI